MNKKISLQLFLLSSFFLGTSLQALGHPLSGTYRRTFNNDTMTIDSNGIVTSTFYITMDSGAQWIAQFPERLKQVVGGTSYRTDGLLYGNWTNGNQCSYPATLLIDPSSDLSELDASINMPAQFYDDCTYNYGTQSLKMSFTRE